MHVLHVLGELRASGAEVMLAAAAHEWRSLGVSTTVAAMAPRQGRFAAALSARGYRVIRLPDRPEVLIPPRFARVLRAVRPDVVHLHTERANFWLGAVARSTGTTVVRTVHADFDFDGALRVQRTLQRRLLAAAGVRTVAVSRHVAANELVRFGNRARVVENWIDDRFARPGPGERAAARAGLGIEPDAQVVLTVGNCAPVKRHGLVLAVLGRLAARWPRLSYLHVGEETSTVDERGLALREGVLDRVRFLGGGDPLPALHAADVFVMPSSREGLGLACAEALAVGVRTVVADSPGLRAFGCYPDLVRVVPGTADALADAVEEWLTVPPRPSGPDAVSDAVRRRFSMRRGVREQVAVYREVAAATPPGPAARTPGG